MSESRSTLSAWHIATPTTSPCCSVRIRTSLNCVSKPRDRERAGSLDQDRLGISGQSHHEKQTWNPQFRLDQS
jgi:hypothetical protein